MKLIKRKCDQRIVHATQQVGGLYISHCGRSVVTKYKDKYILYDGNVTEVTCHACIVSLIKNGNYFAQWKKPDEHIHIYAVKGGYVHKAPGGFDAVCGVAVNRPRQWARRRIINCPKCYLTIFGAKEFN